MQHVKIITHIDTIFSENVFVTTAKETCLTISDESFFTNLSLRMSVIHFFNGLRHISLLISISTPILQASVYGIMYIDLFPVQYRLGGDGPLGQLATFVNVQDCNLLCVLTQRNLDRFIFCGIIFCCISCRKKNFPHTLRTNGTKIVFSILLSPRF